MSDDATPGLEAYCRKRHNHAIHELDQVGEELRRRFLSRSPLENEHHTAFLRHQLERADLNDAERILALASLYGMLAALRGISGNALEMLRSKP